MFSYHIFKNGIFLSYDDEVFDIDKDSDLYNKVLNLIRKKEFEKIRDIVDVKTNISNLSNSKFEVVDGAVYSYGIKVNDYISNKIIEFIDNDLPFDYLLNFWNNLINNPSKSSVDELYLFLEHNKYPLTSDGHFIAYKKVTENFKDIATETFDNSIGSIVEMDRIDVCSDRNITCSYGLHAASYEYAKNFYGTDSGILVQVKINPVDVVSVPHDYNNAKLRCCKYEVVSAFNYELESKIYETVKIGNYSYHIDDISLSDVVYRSKNDIGFKKRKPSAIPKSIKEIGKYSVQSIYTEKNGTVIKYFGIYKDKYDNKKCFVFNKVDK